MPTAAHGGMKVPAYPTATSGLGYSDVFRIKRITTPELKDPATMEALRKQGYDWIRRLNPHRFDQIVRCPTVGCTVEVSVLQHPGCIPIDSPQAKKMINRICYF